MSCDDLTSLHVKTSFNLPWKSAENSPSVPIPPHFVLKHAVNEVFIDIV